MEVEKDEVNHDTALTNSESDISASSNHNHHVRPISANSSPKSSPLLQHKGSDVELRLGSVGQALMSTSQLSSSLAIPQQPSCLSVNTSPLTSREPSVEATLQKSSSKERLDESLGNLSQNVPADQKDINGSQDNVSRSSESGRSFDGNSFSAPRPCELRIDSEKAGGRSSSGETKGTTSSTGKTSEKKKKSSAWYNVLNPTYKSRSDDFKKIFKDLPESERLIVDYSCAMQKDLIVHGRLYLSQNYICFYANIFRWETTVTLKCKDITSMTKERTARVIPNAIQICSDSEKHFFTSFAARDKTYLMLFRVWQNALLDQPMAIQELWQWVHHSYGDELGLTSDDDDYVAPLDDKNEANNDLPDSPEKSLHVSTNQLDDDEDEVDNYKPQVSFEGVHGGKHKPMECEKAADVPTDMSDTTDTNEPEAEIPCPCSSHQGKEVVNEVFSFSVDQMFALLFSGSKFLANLYECRKIYDIVHSEWTESEQQAHKMRQLTYTVSLNNPMSPKTASTTETQTLLENKPQHLYMVRSDVVSTGIPYGDSFSCYTNFCMTKVNSKKCRLKVNIGVAYRKSVFGLVKSFIDKNAIANMQDYFNDLCIALHREAGTNSNVAKPKKSRRRRRIKMADAKNDFAPETAHNVQSSLRKSGSNTTQVDGPVSTASEFFIKIVFTFLLLLLLLNTLLFYKLWVLEEQTGFLTSVPPHQYFHSHKFQSNMENKLPQTNEDWAKLLQRHEMLNQLEREKWKALVSDVIKLIQSTESSLSVLFESIQAGSSGATPDVCTQKSTTQSTRAANQNQRMTEHSSK